MRYSIEPRGRIYIKCYGFLSFAKNISTHKTKVVKNTSKKYSKKHLDSAKESRTDAMKINPKRAIQKTAKSTCDLIGNKIDDNITSILKSLQNALKELH